MGEGADWETRARALIGQEFPPVAACDPVNAPMIRHWCEAMGLPLDWNDPVAAPATMLQCWLFPGPSRARPPGSATTDATSVQGLLAQGGYTAALTVSAEYEFVRPLHPGDRLDYVSALESISEEKRTALGPGRFLGYLLTVRDDRGATVGRLRFTNLVHKPQ